MRFDIPSLVVAATILLVAALRSIGWLPREVAYNGFIILPLLGFAWSRRQVCRACVCLLYTSPSPRD